MCVCVFSLGGRITVNKYLFYDACVCALYRHAVVVVVVVNTALDFIFPFRF